MPCVIAAVGVAATIALTAAPASAVIVRLPSGQTYSYQPAIPKGIAQPLNGTKRLPRGSKPVPLATLSGAARRHASGPVAGLHAPGAPDLAGAKAAAQLAPPGAGSIFDSVFSNLDYSGGPVMHSNINYVIAWDPANYQGTPFQTDNLVPAAGFVPGVTQFFQDLAGDSGSHTNVDSVATQYSDASGGNAAYNSSYGGLITDTNPLPSNGCSGAVPYCITDAQVQAELNGVLSAHGLPRDLSHEYFLLTPPDVAICQPGNACSVNQGANAAFCAYHESSAMGFLYSAVPDLSGNTSCDLFAIDGLDYPNSWADGVLSGLSHEHIESITDPQPNNAWTDYQPCDGAGQPQCNKPEWISGEIGDKCGYQQQDDPNTQVIFDGFGFTAYNQLINGHPYWIQPEWSNQGDPSNGPVTSTDNFVHCLDHWTPNGSTATASFMATGETGTAVSFNAGASSATGGVREYVWQFNDDVAPGDTAQQNTIETASPTISHTFPKIGQYQVVLTVMGPDGISGIAAHPVNVTASPTAVFSYSPSSPEAGSAVSFDASASAEPSPGVSITSYSWTFGDGGTASGAHVNHTFASAGSEAVTLTVTNSNGQTGSIVHTVTVVTKQSGGGGGGQGGGGHGGGCVVPRVTGDSLAKARNVMGSAGCAVGRVKSPKHKPHRRPGKHKRWALVVSREAPAAGTSGPKGERVALVLSWRAVRR